MEFLYRQIGATLLEPQSLSKVLDNWDPITEALSEPPRKRHRFNFRA
jgi:hypothetical protein